MKKLKNFYKTFLTLPLYEQLGPFGLLKHVVSVILFTAFGYILLAILTGSVQLEPWKYFQSVEKYYIAQAIFLFIGVFVGIFLKVLANFWFPFFFKVPKLDRYLYPIGLIFAWLIINEVWGL